MISIPCDGNKVVSKILSPESVRWIEPTPFKKRKEDCFESALRNPVNAKALEKEKFEKPLLVFADDTRLPSPFVPKLIEKLEAKTSEVTLMVACGTHEIPKEEHAKSVLGDDLFSSYQGNIIYSSTRNPSSAYEPIGTTSKGTEIELNKELLKRDFILSTLCVRPHYFAGWEGGAKALLPGCASSLTISQNHSYVIGNPKAKELITKGNPVREDINEVPSLLEKKQAVTYRILDFVPDLKNEPVAVRFGDPIRAHEELAELGKKVCVVRTKPSSVVITVAEGPLGRNFYQALKAATHSSGIIRFDDEKKPALILVGRMDQGIGSDTFRKEFETYMGMDPDAVMDGLRKRVSEGTFNETLQKINRIVMYLPKVNFMIVSPEAPQNLQKMIEDKDIFFSRDIDEALENLHRSLLNGVTIIPKGNATVPVPL